MHRKMQAAELQQLIASAVVNQTYQELARKTLG